MFGLLGLLNTRAAIDLLQEMARHPDPSIRKRAYLVLAWRRAGSWRLDPRTEAVAIDDLSNPLFIVLDRRDVARVLGFSQDAAPVPALIATLDASDRDTRIAAAWALGRLADKTAIPALQVRAAIDQDTGARVTCYSALADLGSPDGEPNLRAFLQSQCASMSKSPQISGEQCYEAGLQIAMQSDSPSLRRIAGELYREKHAR